METGPDLFYLLQRLQNCPSEFLMNPQLESPPKGYIGQITTGAVVNDLLIELNEDLNPVDIFKAYQYKYTETNKNFLQLILIASYLLYDPWFTSTEKFGKKINSLFRNKLRNLAEIVEAKQFVLDSERREELIRYCLLELNLKPAGESDIQAKDRLTTINSIERKRVIEESKAAQKRAQEIREAIARKEAEEAASKWNRE